MVRLLNVKKKEKLDVLKNLLQYLEWSVFMDTRTLQSIYIPCGGGLFSLF